MAYASIPVDLFNPGHVFACLGFLEAADVLLGDAEGGFDWSDEGCAQFCLSAEGESNPFEAVLEFLSEARIEVVAPKDIEGPWPDGASASSVFPASLQKLLKSDKKGYSANALPVCITKGATRLSVSNWLEGDGRGVLKLFAGNQVAAQLMSNMLAGDPSKRGSVGLAQINPRIRSADCSDPLNEIGPVGGRFGYDARGAWDAMRIGSSLDQQGVMIHVSPLVEILAAIGLEHARPHFRENYEIRYTAWSSILPVTLARVALASAHALLPPEQYRSFRAHLGDDKQYKKCFPAQEEPHA